MGIQRISVTVVIMIGLGLYLYSCEQNSKTVDFNCYSGGDDSSDIQSSEPQLIDPFAETPRENEEAEVMAFWLSGELIAPDSLYQAIDKGLKYIRKTYSEMIPCSVYTFKPAFVTSKLILIFSQILGVEYINGRYQKLDSLNQYYRVQEMDTSRFIRNRLMAELKFKGNLNPLHLAHIYKENLPEMDIVQPQPYVGDWPNLYPWIIDDKLAFFLRDAWGDCPSGCAHSDIYAFIQRDSIYEYKGFYSDTLTQNVPPWFDDAMKAIRRFRFYHFYIDSLYP